MNSVCALGRSVRVYTLISLFKTNDLNKNKPLPLADLLNQKRCKCWCKEPQGSNHDDVIKTCNIITIKKIREVCHNVGGASSPSNKNGISLCSFSRVLGRMNCFSPPAQEK